MADPDNRGQFGDRPDTKQQPKKGGKASSEKQNMSELGKKGAEAQSTQAKRLGGEHSHQNN